jgi:hypothetical protein
MLNACLAYPDWSVWLVCASPVLAAGLCLLVDWLA